MADINELPPPNPDDLQHVGEDGGFSPKSFQTAWLLAFFLGFLGIDRFYLEKRTTGILKFLTFGGAGIWWVVDLWLLMLKPRDRDELALRKNPKREGLLWAVTGLATAFVAVFYGLIPAG